MESRINKSERLSLSTIFRTMKMKTQQRKRIQFFFFRFQRTSDVIRFVSINKSNVYTLVPCLY